MERDGLDLAELGPERSPDQIAQEMNGWQPEDAKAKAFFLKEAVGGPKRGTPNAASQELMQQLKHLIERELFLWEYFPVNLPQTEFDEKDVEAARRGEIELFQAPQSHDETRELAFNADGSRKKLTREQLGEVWRTGTLTVPSKSMPDEKHIWQLSGLLLRGKDNIAASWRKGMAQAARQLIEEVPARFVAPRWSVRAGLRSLIFAPRDLLAKLVGLIEQVPKYSDYQIEEMLLHEQKRFMLEGGIPQIITTLNQRVEDGEKRQPAYMQLPETSPIEKLDLRLSTDQFVRKISQYISIIFSEVSSKWMAERHQWERLAREDLQAKGVTDQEKLDQTVANLSCEERISRLYAAILSSVALEESLPGIGRMIVNYLKALRIVRTREMEQAALELKKEQEILSELRRAHPIRSKLSGWLSSRCEQLMRDWLKETRSKIDIDILDQLRRDGLAQEAYLFDRANRFTLERFSQRKQELGALRSPARTWEFLRPIWLPKNWVIKRVESEFDSSVYYTAEKTRSYKTRSDVPFYRFWNMYHWTMSSWSFGFLGLTWNLLKGPLSLKALFSPKPYYSRPTLDSNTGKIIDDPYSLTQTFGSRIGAIWAHVSRSRASFEAEPDTGFIGKTVSRLFNVFWNYVVKGFVGTATVALCQPVLTAINLVLTLFLMLTSFIWAPASALIRWLICFFIFDFDHAKYGSVRSPFITTVIWGLIIRGILNVGTSLAGALVIHPIIAALIAAFRSVTAGSRFIYDCIMFALVVWHRARVPANDGFLAKRIHGPGMAASVFVQLEPADALVALRATLERVELDLWRARISSAINKPRTRLDSHPLLYAFTGVGLSLSTGMHQFDPIRKNCEALMKELERKISARYRVLPSVPNGHMVRLTRRDLETLLENATKMVRDFVSNRILPLHTEVETITLWSSTWNLERGDFVELARKFLAQTFSYEILRPLEDSERTVRLKVHKFKFREMVVDAAPADPLEKTSVEVTVGGRSVAQPTVSSFESSDVTSCGSSSDRVGMLSPLTRFPPYFELIEKKEDEK
eukprot:TRINITY_DN4953_c0_g1_i1.p1 TRINITY_DN4953_c0_g1~~TRINITY_DN4953_c0_g1_i1.p1  ORF type:complete len:1037 (-),score=201.20 TRINITY_DN4953_c0_g1_i1:66-3176(-)